MCTVSVEVIVALAVTIALIVAVINSRIKTWWTWPTDDTKSWYYHGSLKKRWFGNLAFHFVAAVVYATLAVVIPAWRLKQAGSVEYFLTWLGENYFIAIIWLAVVTLMLPLFIWHEQLAFDDWITTIADPKEKRKIVARFNLNAKHMEIFWKTVASLYLTAGLFSVVGKDKPNKPDKAPTKKHVIELTQAVKQLAEVEAKKLDSRNDGNKSGGGDEKQPEPKSTNEAQPGNGKKDNPTNPAPPLPK